MKDYTMIKYYSPGLVLIFLLLATSGCVPGDGVQGPPLVYIDNGDGTITDRNTGLMWEKKAEDDPDKPGGPGTCLTDLHNVNSRCTFEEATGAWIDAVNSEVNREDETLGFAGHTDWRVPHAKELLSIVDYSRCGTSVSDPLSPCLLNAGATHPDLGPTHPTLYWTVTLDAYDPVNQVFGVGFIGGGVTTLAKLNAGVPRSRRVRAVRDIRALPFSTSNEIGN